MLKRNPRLLFRAAPLLACLMLGGCSSSERTPDSVEWTPSAKPVDADRYEYLRERHAKVLSLVVTKLSEESDPGVRAALSCMRAYPPADVVAGDVRLDSLHKLIAAALAAMPVAMGECEPLAAEWRYSTLEAHSADPDPSPSPGGQEVLGLALAGGAVWVGLCGSTLGVVCPVASEQHFQLATEVTLPNGMKQSLTGNALTARWKASAWTYRKVRDEVFAAGLSEALLSMAKAYAAALQDTPQPPGKPFLPVTR